MPWFFRKSTGRWCHKTSPIAILRFAMLMLMPRWTMVWWSRWWGCSLITTRLWGGSCRHLCLLLRYEKIQWNVVLLLLKTIHFEISNLQKSCNNSTVTPVYSLLRATVNTCLHVYNSFTIFYIYLSFHF